VIFENISRLDMVTEFIIPTRRGKLEGTRQCSFAKCIPVAVKIGEKWLVELVFRRRFF